MSARWAVPMLLAAILIGVVGSIEAGAFMILPAIAVIVAVGVLAHRHPRGFLSFAMLLVLVAGTKFRNRDPSASLAETIDLLVILELALYAIVALIVAAAMLSPAFRRSRLAPMELLLVAYAAVALVSVIWSESPALTVVRAGQLGVLLALGLVSVRVIDVAGTLHALGTAVVGYVLLCAAITVAVPYTRVVSIVAFGNERFSWFAMHSISASTFTAIAILYLFCVMLFVPGGWKARRLGVPVTVALLPLCVVMIATNSRGPLFALLGSIAAVLAFRYLHPVSVLVMAAAAAMFVVTATAIGLTPSSILTDVAEGDPRIAMIVLRGQTQKDFGTLTGRTELWAALIPLYLQRPVLGYGYQASRSAILRVRAWAGHAHNALLQTLMDVGALGALLLWIPFARTLFARPRARAPTDPSTAWAGATIFAFTIFTLINSVSDVTFAGPPGYELLLVLCSVMAAVRLEAVEVRAAMEAEVEERWSPRWQRGAAPTSW